MSEYVTARIIRLDEVDFGLFDWDRHNTVYFFVLNADEQIYLRYGGRDARSFDSYLGLESLELALEKGLELHEKYKAGELPKKPRGAPDFAKDYPLLVERTIGNGACVECHLVNDYKAQHKELDGTLDKVRDMYRSPDIRTIGIHLDAPKGLLVASAEGMAQAAGMQPGDTITALEGVPVYTFGDLQYNYDKVDRAARSATFTVDRAGESVDLAVELPLRWWLTNLDFRHWTIEPRVYFESDPLTAEEKRSLDLPEDGFASRVRLVEGVAGLLGLHELKVGDIVYGVAGVQTDPDANSAELYLKLRTKSGSETTLQVLRDGERIEMPLKSARMGFRK
ncbi:MAG: hypothetical protein GC160_02475 [Acidobacteria bacterium]|nr:hypothetical protein [Acidobacteriota bacterium]